MSPIEIVRVKSKLLAWQVSYPVDHPCVIALVRAKSMGFYRIRGKGMRVNYKYWMHALGRWK